MAEHLIASLRNLDVGQWNDCDCSIQLMTARSP